MIKRMFCLLCTLLFLVPCVCAGAEDSGIRSYDFDLTFSLNTEAFPPVSRARTQGYADLLDRIALCGNITWNDNNDSFDITASVVFLNKPDTSVDFRLYGRGRQICLTSPLLNGETVFFNMAAFMEYALKAKSNLNVPLPWIALLYPYTTEYGLTGLREVWDAVIGDVTESCEIPAEKFKALGQGWDRKLLIDDNLLTWINGVTSGAVAPEAVEAEIGNLPFYPEQYLSGGGNVTVTIGDGSETWVNAKGQTLYTRSEGENAASWTCSLPATENRYQPLLSWSRTEDASGVSLRLQASWARQPKEKGYTVAEAVPSGEGKEDTGRPSAISGDLSEPEGTGTYSEYTYSENTEEETGVYTEEEYSEEGGGEGGYEDDGDEEGGDAFPDNLFSLTFTADGLPASLPAYSAFEAAVSVRGAVYPNYAFLLQGETKTDGSVSLALCKPRTGEKEPVRILTCKGTVTPLALESAPRYTGKFYDGAFGFFAFNEEKLANFKNAVLPSLIRGVIALAEEIPASTFQSFLDDLTDAGILGVVLEN